MNLTETYQKYKKIFETIGNQLANANIVDVAKDQNERMIRLSKLEKLYDLCDTNEYIISLVPKSVPGDDKYFKVYPYDECFLIPILKEGEEIEIGDWDYHDEIMCAQFAEVNYFTDNKVEDEPKDVLISGFTFELCQNDSNIGMTEWAGLCSLRKLLDLRPEMFDWSIEEIFKRGQKKFLNDEPPFLDESIENNLSAKDINSIRSESVQLPYEYYYNFLVKNVLSKIEPSNLDAEFKDWVNFFQWETYTKKTLRKYEKYEFDSIFHYFLNFPKFPTDLTLYLNEDDSPEQITITYYGIDFEESEDGIDILFDDTDDDWEDLESLYANKKEEFMELMKLIKRFYPEAKGMQI